MTVPTPLPSVGFIRSKWGRCFVHPVLIMLLTSFLTIVKTNTNSAKLAAL